jgi:ribosomal protein L22
MSEKPENNDDQIERADEEAARAAAAADEAVDAAAGAESASDAGAEVDVDAAVAAEEAADEATEAAERAEEAAEAAAEAPRKSRSRKARAAEIAADEAEEAADEATEAAETAAETEDETVAETADEAAAEQAAEAKPARRRRGKPAGDEPSEETPARTAPTRRRDQRRPVDPGVAVRAQAKYVRTSARKARLVCDHIRGKDVAEARAILAFTPRAAAKDWAKLLESAVANAEHNHELVGEDLRIAAVYADEGPTLKRYRPRAMGRATRIRKRTSHLTITLTPKEL